MEHGHVMPLRLEQLGGDGVRPPQPLPPLRLRPLTPCLPLTLSHHLPHRRALRLAEGSLVLLGVARAALGHDAILGGRGGLGAGSGARELGGRRLGAQAAVGWGAVLREARVRRVGRAGGEG